MGRYLAQRIAGAIPTLLGVSLLTFAQPIVLQPGQGLKSVITWNNTTNHVVSFGLQSTDEMGIIFGYYY